MKSRQFLASALLGAAALLFSPFTFASGGTGTGGGGGGAAMQIATKNGLYLVDNPAPGEASIRGFVTAMLSSTYATPADTVVTINGTRLIPAPGLNFGWFIVDPTAPQPLIGSNGTLQIQASSQSANTTRVLKMQCPVPVALSATPAVGSSLNGMTSVDLAWTQLPQNVASVLTGSFMDLPMVLLSSYDIASNTVTGPVSSQFINQSSVGATLGVQPTASTGYLAQLIYPGVYVLDGNSGGNCGRIQRAAFTN